MSHFLVTKMNVLYSALQSALELQLYSVASDSIDSKYEELLVFTVFSVTSGMQHYWWTDSRYLLLLAILQIA